MASVHILFTDLSQAYWLHVSLLFGLQLASRTGKILQPEGRCKQEETACFSLASVANHLPAKCFLSDPEMEIRGCEISIVGGVMHDLRAVALYAVGSPVASAGLGIIVLNDDALEQQPKPFVRNGLPQPVKFTTVNIQQLQCHHIQGNVQDACLYGAIKGSCHDLPY